MALGKINGIKSDIKLKIKTGQWPLGYKLPTQRRLAEIYKVNRSTIVTVMEELMADGLVETKGRLGTFVINQSWALLASEQPRHWGEAVDHGLHQANQPIIQAINSLEFDPQYIRLGTGELSPSLYPKEEVEASLNRVGKKLTQLGYECPKGSLELRRALSKYLSTHGIETSPEGILIVSGSLQALQLISIGIMSPQAALFTEKPSYVKSLNTFQSVGIKLIGVKMDEEGINLKALAQSLSDHSAKEKVLYTIPTFQNPTGKVMGTGRREELLKFASKNGLAMIEDDAYRELWLDEIPPKPLKAMDPHGNVLYMGTVSKSLAAGLRIGWVVGTESVIERLGDIKMQLDYGASSVSQALVTDWLEGGIYQTYLEKLRGALRERRDLMLRILEVHFSDLCTWEKPAGGLYIWLKLKHQVPMGVFFKKALGEKILLNPGEIYDYDKNQYLRLSYAYALVEELEDALPRLALLLRETLVG